MDSDEYQDKPGDSNSTLKMKAIWRLGMKRWNECDSSYKVYKGCVKTHNSFNLSGTYAECGKCKIFNKRKRRE